MSYRDKNVVVTGGTGGLGQAVTRLLAEQGASIFVPAMEESIPTPFAGPQYTLKIDLTNEEQVADYFEHLPAISASIHLAGGFAMAAIEETSVADLERQWALNAKTCFLSCKHAVANMRRNKVAGKIVNVAARPVVQPAPLLSAYAMSKAAVVALTQTLAIEVLGDGIAVNAVLPSIIDTPANRSAMPNADYETWPKPEDLAESILFLAGASNALTSGAAIPVYGRA